ncbi:MAG: hypothetical protein DRO40_13515 [Thermoprotei archaeon]|nr:MAG: hypothetical protein DRO40_13515 [Thermoprotei archaeon]
MSYAVSGKVWCDLPLEYKILLVLGAANRPLSLERIKIYIFIMDTVYRCNDVLSAGGSKAPECDSPSCEEEEDYRDTDSVADRAAEGYERVENDC